MNAIQRFSKYRDDDFDRVMLLIKNGTIKSGKYSHLVKVDKDKKINDKEFFNHEDSKSK